MRFPFSFNPYDEKLEAPTGVYDFECEIELSRDGDEYIIDGVWRDGRNLAKGNALTVELAKAASDEFEARLNAGGDFRLEVDAYMAEQEDDEADYAREAWAEARAELYAERRM